jgi:hypothetical protein
MSKSVEGAAGPGNLRGDENRTDDRTNRGAIPGGFDR